MPDLLVDGEIALFGAVGDNYWGEGFTARDVLDALAQVKGKDIIVRLNSGGGLADEGVAIYHALSMHDGKVTIQVEGIAASAASTIAMAGDDIVMRKGTLMMIHDPANLSMGTLEDHERNIEYLTRLADNMAGIYADSSGRAKQDCRADMKKETWLTAEEAVAMGYAKRVDDAAAAEASAFDYRVYAAAPEPLRALASVKGWDHASRKAAAKAAQPPKEKTNMTTPNPNPAAPSAEALAAAKEATDRALAITEACAAAGEPAMAAALIREGITLDAAKARAAQAKDIRQAVALAAKTCAAIDPKIAESYIAAGAGIEKVRSDLFEKIAAAQAAAPTRSGLDLNAQQPEANLMSKAMAKVNSRLPGTRTGHGVAAK